MPDILELVRGTIDQHAVEPSRSREADAQPGIAPMVIDVPDADGEFDLDAAGDERWDNDADEDAGDGGFVEEGGLEGDLDIEEE